VHPAAQANVLALAEILRDEGRVLDELVDSVLAGRSEISLARLRELAPALRRLVVQRLADTAAGGARGRRRPPGGRGGGAARQRHRDARSPPRRQGYCDRGRGALRAHSGAPSIHFAPVTDEHEVGEILVGAEDLRRRVRELAQEVSRDYAGKDLLLIGVLKGAVFFLSDLMRHLEIPVEVDFMAVASYGSATKSSGVVRILKDLDAAIEGRDVLIVEDIVDSGLTLQYLLRNLAGRNPASLEVCALLIKPERRKVDLQTRYVGFEIPNRFAIGYGLDYAERYRNLPYVAALEQ
jgi:hypoxanthine phosphoribosyltransferase